MAAPVMRERAERACERRAGRSARRRLLTSSSGAHDTCGSPSGGWVAGGHAEAGRARVVLCVMLVGMDGFQVSNATGLGTIAIWPKLYRRLSAYFGKATSTSLAGFDAWLRQKPDSRDDQLWIIQIGVGRARD